MRGNDRQNGRKEFCECLEELGGISRGEGVDIAAASTCPDEGLNSKLSLGAKARLVILARMYGLKPVPFRPKPVSCRRTYGG